MQKNKSLGIPGLFCCGIKIMTKQNMTKIVTRSYAAQKFLEKHMQKNKISHISELFSKETLIENVYDSDWTWSMKDEMEENHLSKEEAQKKTIEWFHSMSKIELWVERISDSSKRCLIEDMADKLGFESELLTTLHA